MLDLVGCGAAAGWGAGQAFLEMGRIAGEIKAGQHGEPLQVVPAKNISEVVYCQP